MLYRLFAAAAWLSLAGVAALYAVILYTVLTRDAPAQFPVVAAGHVSGREQSVPPAMRAGGEMRGGVDFVLLIALGSIVGATLLVCFLPLLPVIIWQRRK